MTNNAGSGQPVMGFELCACFQQYKSEYQCWKINRDLENEQIVSNLRDFACLFKIKAGGEWDQRLPG
jgi:hypothetical protein